MAGDSTAHFDDSCWIGVGIDSTATDTSMTGLQCTADSQHIAMCDSFTRGTNGVSRNWWLGVDSTEANFTWREFVLWNDSAATALDRMVHDHGLHPTNEQWLWRCEVKIE